MPRNSAARATTAENNKERFHWRERAAAPFEGKYSKHRANLKRRREKRHAGGESDLEDHAKLGKKRERER